MSEQIGKMQQEEADRHVQELQGWLKKVVHEELEPIIEPAKKAAATAKESARDLALMQLFLFRSIQVLAEANGMNGKLFIEQIRCEVGMV